MIWSCKHVQNQKCALNLISRGSHRLQAGFLPATFITALFFKLLRWIAQFSAQSSRKVMFICPSQDSLSNGTVFFTCKFPISILVSQSVALNATKKISELSPFLLFGLRLPMLVISTRLETKKMFLFFQL